MPSKKKASILNRDNYKEGSEVNTLQQIINLQDQYNKAFNNASTDQERNTITNNFNKMMRNYTDQEKTDAAKKREEERGSDINEELFSTGFYKVRGIDDVSRVSSFDDQKDLRMGQATGGSLIGKQTELDVNNDGKISGKDFQMLKKKRMGKQEGSLMMPPEMEQDMPVDTYPNIPPEEMDEAMASQLPDAEMEDKYLDFVLEESLDDEEQSYLMNALEADPKLSQIFDKVVTTASEFTGAGEVEGPGTGVSDSIPARLSDGEFVFTKKATDQMGADNLQMMMDDAERAFDGGQMRESAETGGLLLYNQEDDNPLAYEKIAQDEIKKNMLRSNRAPSLMAG